jgi:mono/diheme cytochrome c family protein
VIRLHLSVLVLATMLLACADEPQQAAPSPEPAAAPTAAAPAQAVVLRQFERVRSWPLLDQWLAGEPIAVTAAYGRPEITPQLEADGRVLFNMYCWQCHGREGRGEGPRSPMFDPPPRDLTLGVFKFRSTPSGKLPTSADLFQTITGGLRGTGMMAFADVAEAERWAMVAYVRTLSPRFAEERAAATVNVPAVPDNLDAPEHIMAGQQTFADLGCVQCHGDAGRGDGPAAATLKDTWGNKLLPPDLLTRRPKHGRSASDLYLALATGLDGTPMPAYGEGARPQQLWEVVSFVRAMTANAESGEQRAIDEADKVLSWQHKQGRHAVVGGCGCGAKRRAKREGS